MCGVGGKQWCNSEFSISVRITGKINDDVLDVYNLHLEK